MAKLIDHSPIYAECSFVLTLDEFEIDGMTE